MVWKLQLYLLYIIFLGLTNIGARLLIGVAEKPRRVLTLTYILSGISMAAVYICFLFFAQFAWLCALAAILGVCKGTYLGLLLKIVKRRSQLSNNKRLGIFLIS